MRRRFITGFGLALLVPGFAFGAAIVRSAAGFFPSDIAPAVDQFRAAVGGTNNGAGGTFTSGRREINWDGVPDAVSSPSSFPANFFNSNSARGVVFSTPGSGFQVSAKAGNPTVTALRFGNINPNYPFDFQTFSPEKLFAPIGSTITDVSFFVPGTSTPASTSGFGVVFTDVDSPTSTTLQFFDQTGVSLGTFAAPALLPGNQNLSFLGVFFNAGERVTRVRITSGNTALGPSDSPPTGVDVVAMDDFIYGEPQGFATGCVTDATSLCVNNGRFRIQVNFRTTLVFQPATAVGIAADAGAFWFFSANNLEVLAKVVDGRPFNGKYWVFIASATNVEYTVTVTDTVGGAVKTYNNAAGNLQSIVDLSAF